MPRHRSRRSRDRRSSSPFKKTRKRSSSPDDSKSTVKTKYSSRLGSGHNTYKTSHRRIKSRRSRSSSSRSSSTESQSHKSSSVERKYTEKRQNSPKMPTLNVSTQINQKVLDQIETDCFTSAPFTSSNSKKIPDKVIIDLQNETVSVAATENSVSSSNEAIFHNKFFASEQVRLEKWVKKLFNYRQRSCQE